MNYKKVLVITHHWPPKTTSGLQRWFKFVKYLPEFGWTPVVVTPNKFHNTDESFSDDLKLDTEVFYVPYTIPNYLRYAGKNTVKSAWSFFNIKIKNKIKDVIRQNFIFPDVMVYWNKPTIEKIETYLSKNKVNLIVTSGPQHSIHYIGEAVQKLGVPWIIDLRDPWSDWDRFDINASLFRPIVISVHSFLERKTLSKADKIVVVTQKMKELYEGKGYRDVKVITNGVDPSDMVDSGVGKTEKFRVGHYGLINAKRSPNKLIEVLEDLCRGNSEFNDDLELVFSGPVNQPIKDIIASKKMLADKFKYIEYIPHKDIYSFLINTDLVLLLTNKTSNADLLIPGKLFELLYCGQDILAFGTKSSDVHEILLSCGGKGVTSYSDRDEIKSRILAAYERYKTGKVHTGYHDIEKYFRVNLTQQMADLFDKVAEQKK